MTSWWAAPGETRWPALNRSGWARLAVAACYFAAVNWMVFAPGDTFDDVQELFAHQDKIAHGAIFLLLAALVRWSLPAGADRIRADRRLRYGVPAALVLYACSAELLQPLIAGEGRRFEWLDMAANLTGLLLGWLLFAVTVAKRECRV